MSNFTHVMRITLLCHASHNGDQNLHYKSNLVWVVVLRILLLWTSPKKYKPQQPHPIPIIMFIHHNHTSACWWASKPPNSIPWKFNPHSPYTSGQSTKFVFSIVDASNYTHFDQMKSHICLISCIISHNLINFFNSQHQNFMATEVVNHHGDCGVFGMSSPVASSHCDSMIFKALSLWKLVAALKGKSRQIKVAVREVANLTSHNKPSTTKTKCEKSNFLIFMFQKFKI